MKILFLSKLGDALGVADRLSQEGHDVRFWTEDRNYNRDLSGIVSRIDTWRPSVPWADLIICDMVGFSQFLPVFQRYAKPTLSCNPVADVLELNRVKAIQTARAVGMTCPESWNGVPPTLPEKGLVVKPSGNQGPSQTRVVKTEKQLKWALDQLPNKEDVLFQEVVEGIEVSTEGWFNGTDWITPFNHTFEEKKLMPGNTGPGTGCMGNVVIPAQHDKLVKETLEKMTPFLRKAGYRGPLDINCIVNQDTAYFLEFTCRMGYDAVEALMTGLKEPVGALLFETATGVKKEMALTKDYMISVRLAQPPYPFHFQDGAEAPLEGIIPENRKFIYLCGVKKVKDNLLTTGSDGVVAKVTASGRSIQEARSRVKRTLNNIKGIDLFWRHDVGARAEKDIDQLKQWGWL